jgi:DNA-binding transcriptional regulator YhcF (GntR family)
VSLQPDFALDRSAGVPLGTQLAARIRAGVRDGSLSPDDQLPSVRALADAVGVNVNTVRAVYSRLEAEGVVRSEQGRGTFVAGPPADEAATRRELRRQIAQLEASLARLPPPPTLAHPAPRRPRSASLLSTEDLTGVRDALLDRLAELDEQRAAVIERLGQLGMEGPTHAPAPRRATPSLAGAQIRWVGA